MIARLLNRLKRFAPLVAGALILGSAPPLLAQTEIRSTSSIANRETFDALSRTQKGGRFIEFPQVMFAIELNPSGHRIFWINTRIYKFHYQYLKSIYLKIRDINDFNYENYSNPKRKFLLGSVIYYPGLDRYGVEFWEQDVIEPELLSSAMNELQAAFFTRLTLKPNSTSQRAAAAKTGLPTIGVDEVYGSFEQLVLNPGRAVGRLTLVAPGEEARLLPGDIALLKTVPIRMPPVSGILASSFTTPINHISLLAKAWGIPNAYQARADSVYAPLIGKQVVLDARATPIVLREASAAEIAEATRLHQARAVRAAPADLAYSGLPSLIEQDAGWSARTGAKAANLGEVAQLSRRDPYHMFDVPAGFSVPFAFYDRFVAANHIDERVEAFLSNPRRDDPDWRRAELARIRQAFADGRIPLADFADITSRRFHLLGDKGVFVRSSTNAEDLPRFNGAGLYETVPNVRGAEQLARAMKTVWGSIWNERAYAARTSAGIDHRSVRAAILIQLGVDADAAGVMTTIDPFDEHANEKRVFIVAKQGLGIRVVEGEKIAEQWLYRADLGSARLISRSQDDVMLHFDADGGVKAAQAPQAAPEQTVLSEDQVTRLALAGLAIQASFDDRPQDIEWVLTGGRIMIVQSRNYVEGN